MANSHTAVDLDAEIDRLDKLISARRKHRNAVQALAMYEAHWPKVRKKLLEELQSAETELKEALEQQAAA